MLLATSTLQDVDGVRSTVHGTAWGSVEQAAQATAEAFVQQFPSIVLARLFALVPFASLPADEQAFARALVKSDARLGPRTLVLTLLGTAGAEPSWNARQASVGHRAIPLLDQGFIEEIPMIAALLHELEVDVTRVDNAAIAMRRLLGGKNGRFYVADAAAARDGRGRHIIAGRDFVERHQVKTVFGMGGAYVDGTIVVAIAFSSESVPVQVVDLFPSIIGNFKMATMGMAAKGHWFAQAG